MNKIEDYITYENEVLEKVKSDFALEVERLSEKGFRVEYALWWIADGEIHETRPKKTTISFISVIVYDNENNDENERVEYNFPIINLGKAIEIENNYPTIVRGINNILDNGYENEYKECQKAAKDFSKKLVIRRRLIIVWGLLLLLAGTIIAILYYVLQK